MKNLTLLLSALTIVGTGSLLVISTVTPTVANAAKYKPQASCPSGYTLKKGLRGATCIMTTSRTPSCPSRQTKKVKSIGKDKCQRLPTEMIKNPECKVGTGNFQRNWQINHVRGQDNCTHKTKQKGVKRLKCSGNSYSLVIDKNNNTDQCVKSSGRVVSTNITCRTGETHKTKGTDQCETKRETRPTFN